MIIYLKPISTFPKLHSDTIFGAFCSILTEIYPNFVEELIEDFKVKPPFIISSAFPYITINNNKKHFLPKIDIFEKKYDSSNSLDSYKKYKKIKYIEEDIFFDIIEKNITSTEIINNLESYNIQSQMLLNEDVNDIKVSSTIHQKNIIHRINNSSLNTFYTQGYQYKNMGLYFIIKIYDEKYNKKLKTGIKLLRDRGFGANISTGQGHFDYDIDEESEFEEKLFNTKGNYFLTLSRYIPTKEEIQKINMHSTYTLSSKRGIKSNGELKKKIQFFEEGSIFPSYQQNYGKIVNVGTVTPSIEYGYAFPIKMEVDSDGI